MLLRIIAGLFLVFIVFAGQGYASDVIQQEEQIETSELIVIPFGFFGPDTKWGVGTGATYAFARTALEKRSAIQAVIIYTELHQIKTALIPDFYFNNNIWHWRNALGYTFFPDEFYGLGPNSTLEHKERFVEKTWAWSSKIEYNWFKDLYSGLFIDLQNTTLFEINDDPIMCQITEHEGPDEVIWGMGPTITWDSRDTIFYPSKGTYVELKWLGFPAVSGREVFYLTQIDARWFVSMFEDVIVGFQGIYKNQQGTVPFIRMSRLGEFLRGYKKNRYQDQDLWVAQTEVRFDVYDPFKLHLFVGAGNIFNSDAENALEALKFAGGIGLRYRISKDHLNIKLDVAFSREKDIAVYFDVREAF